MEITKIFKIQVGYFSYEEYEDGKLVFKAVRSLELGEQDMARLRIAGFRETVQNSTHVFIQSRKS